MRKQRFRFTKLPKIKQCDLCQGYGLYGEWFEMMGTKFEISAKCPKCEGIGFIYKKRATG